MNDDVTLISNLICRAFDEAHRLGDKKNNAQRSAFWIECLAKAFRSIEWEEDIAVFSKDYYGNRVEFGMNEMLYDVTVAEIKTIKSARSKEIKVISNVKWLIESEFQKSNSRAITIDFSKLVIGRAENKLLIISEGMLIPTWIENAIPEIIKSDNCNFYLAVIPHPKDWHLSDLPIPSIRQLKCADR
jgi:hypothetical protein